VNTLTQITDGQKRLITRIIGDVAESDPVQDALGKLDKEGAERLKGNPDFAEGLRQFVVTQIVELSVSNRFANEEATSNYGYLSGYQPKGITQQCNRLRELIPGLGYANLDLLKQVEDGTIMLPANAEGWFAIPNIWKKGGQTAIGTTDSECVHKVLDLIKQTRGALYNYREGQVDEKHIRQLAKTKKVMEEISEAQGNPDILIISAQFGLRHRGRSVRRAREVFTSNEFGLGAFVVGIMILTHPERLMNYDDLWIDCSGDEWSPDGDGGFSRAPCFFFVGGWVGFGAHVVGLAYDCYGSASGFPPQAPQVQ
jgi:hypothetical protein